MDALVPNRGASGISHHYSSEVNEFLTQLNECWKSRVLVIGATNRLDSIDQGVQRPGRMDKKVFIGPPDIEARYELLKLYMEGRPQERIEWIDLAEASDYYTSAELENVINEAARLALAGERRISASDISTALKASPPALGPETIERSRKIGF